MTQDEAGKYRYTWNIPDNACYGRYKAIVTTTSYNTKYNFDFYIMPWNANSDVRELSGIGENKSISDDALNELIWNCYREVQHLCYTYHEYEQPNYCRDVGTQCGIIDGVNTTFYTRDSNIATISGEDAPVGYGETSGCTDVDGIWKDKDTTCQQCKITILDAECGKMTITKLDGTAIPTDAKGIYLKYYTQVSNFNITIFNNAVNYLAAHKVILRFGELERATAADLNSAQNIKYVNPKRMYKEYKRIIRLIRKPAIGGGDYPE